MAERKNAAAILGEQDRGRYISRLVRGLNSESPAMDHEDIRADAYEGLCKAALRYNPDTGTSLETFAWSRTRGAAIDGVRRVNGTRRRVRRQVQSLDRADSVRAAESLPDTDPSVEAQAESNAGVAAIWTAIAELSAEHRLVLETRLRLGLTDKKLAQHLGLSEGRTQLLRREATELLRERLSACGVLE